MSSISIIKVEHYLNSILGLQSCLFAAFKGKHCVRKVNQFNREVINPN